MEPLGLTGWDTEHLLLFPWVKEKRVKDSSQEHDLFMSVTLKVTFD